MNCTSLIVVYIIMYVVIIKVTLKFCLTIFVLFTIFWHVCLFFPRGGYWPVISFMVYLTVIISLQLTMSLGITQVMESTCQQGKTLISQKACALLNVCPCRALLCSSLSPSSPLPPFPILNSSSSLLHHCSFCFFFSVCFSSSDLVIRLIFVLSLKCFKMSFVA